MHLMLATIIYPHPFVPRPTSGTQPLTSSTQPIHHPSGEFVPHQPLTHAFVLLSFVPPLTSGTQPIHHPSGDFVDRGPRGVEVMCLLLTIFAAFPPKTVMLNRGNHEDYAICCVYGFQTECVEKYDEITFGMFVEVGGVQ